MAVNLQQIKTLWGRYESLKVRNSDPCRSNGSILEYMDIREELIELVPRFIEEIENLEIKRDHFKEDAIRMATAYGEHQKQIDILRRALLKDRFWSLWRLNESNDDVNTTTEQARHQLKCELPEIDWGFE